MIKVKTADNVLTDISEIYIKTSENALTKIAEGYQVVSVNGEKRLIPVFLSECKHNWEMIYYNPSSCVSDEYWTYQCTKCQEEYTEYGSIATGHEWDETGTCALCGEYRGICECYDQIPDESGQICLNCGCYIA